MEIKMKRIILACVFILLFVSPALAAKMSMEVDLGAVNGTLAVGGGVKFFFNKNFGLRIRPVATFSNNVTGLGIGIDGEYTIPESDNFPLDIYIGFGGGYGRGGGVNSGGFQAFGGLGHRFENGPHGVFGEVGVDYYKAAGVGNTDVHAFFGYRYYLFR